MSKYKDWGNKEDILKMKFDDWWKKFGVKLFGMKKKTDKPKYVSTNSPKFDTIHLLINFIIS